MGPTTIGRFDGTRACLANPRPLRDVSHPIWLRWHTARQPQGGVLEAQATLRRAACRTADGQLHPTGDDHLVAKLGSHAAICHCRRPPARLEEAVTQGMRLPLVKALRTAGRSEGVRALDLSSESSALEPRQAEVPGEIRIDREVIASLEPVELQLAKRDEEPRQETIMGAVVELKRAADPDANISEYEGEVVIQGEVDGWQRRVTVPLHGEDYDWTIQAHRRRIPFTVSGRL